MKCKTYFYGENLLFPTSVTAFNDNCFNCDAGQVLLRKAGEKRGKCFDTNANAEATCGGLSWYLRQSTGGDINFAADATTPFTFCE